MGDLLYLDNDTSLTLAQLEATFDKDVAFLVRKATKLEDKIKRINLKAYEYHYGLMNYEDERAALIKLADRLHNMRTIKGHPSIEKQKHIAQETLQFFVPLAKHLGYTTVADELEKLCFGVLG